MFDVIWQTKDRFDDLMTRRLLPHIPESVTPNRVTGVRFWVSVAVIASVLLFFWTPLVVPLALLLLFIAGVTDWMDGWLARARGPMTEWGKVWDERADKILVLGAVAALLWHWHIVGEIGWLWLALAFAWSLTLVRDGLMVWLRKLQLAQTVVLSIAKFKTALQMGSLLPLILSEWWQPFAHLGVLLFVLSTGLSLYSGWMYSIPARSRLSGRWSENTGW